LTQLGRLDEAEAILVGLVEDHPHCRRDLAWLYERRGDPVRAQRFLDSYLADHPDDMLAREQRLRLRLQAMPADEIVGEVEALLDLGEKVSGEMFAGYIEAMFAVGKPEVARRRVTERLAGLDVHEAKRLGWTTHRLGAHDLAYSLFVAALPATATDVKLLSALETSARRAGRLEDLIGVYQKHAPTVKRLYGRIAILRRGGSR
jgi:hypothetical protein